MIILSLCISWYRLELSYTLNEKTSLTVCSGPGSARRFKCCPLSQCLLWLAEVFSSLIYYSIIIYSDGDVIHHSLSQMITPAPCRTTSIGILTWRNAHIYLFYLKCAASLKLRINAHVYMQSECIHSVSCREQ